MRAWEIGPTFGLDQLRMVQRPVPEPGPGEVVVRIHACSLNYRDLLVVKGAYHPKMPIPRIPLSDGAGEVVALGAGVSTVREGDRVAGCLLQGWTDGRLTQQAARTGLGGNLDGTLCDYALFRQDGVIHFPEHLTYEQAATLPCAAVTAWNALIEGDVRPGETVLCLGTGGVSLFAMQFAKLAGAVPIVTSKSDAKLARARELGAVHTINHAQEPEWDRVVRELTGGEGVDHVVEVGGAGTLPKSVRAVRHGGHIALIGVLSGAEAEFNPLPALMKGVTIRGVFVGSHAMFAGMNAAISAAKLTPIVDRVFPFDRIQDALAYLERGEHFGKVVLAGT
jgi:NADPH:quinone reductase-like Zn-dependent oxidoreductase